MQSWAIWEQRCAAFLAEHMAGDSAHDLAHVHRVVANAVALAREERADLAVVLPAAWLHDCITVPKDSPLRAQASALAARVACRFLEDAGYPPLLLPAISHAIETHSFSAGIAPQTLEARVVQDADRLDALGAIGIARCLALGGALGRSLYHPDEPLPHSRPADDRAYTLDHFPLKLLRLAGQMTTAAGRAEAERRTAFMRAFLEELVEEIGWGK
ncbi:MAG: HD domain-containing protein [Roseiflexaceae bacterium]